MNAALKEARKASKKDYVPVGAMLQLNGKIIARAHNEKFWHAEILCIQKAVKKFGDSNALANATMFVTVEPCAMCMYAIRLARIGKVIFGAYNKNKPLPEPEKIGGINELEAKTLIQEFFQKKRNK